MQTYCEQHPVSLLPSLKEVDFVCPLCKSGLDILPEAYHCSGCDKTYRLHGGIPDFRVFPDPYLDLQEDRDRTEIVLGALERHTLESLLEYYWSLSDVTPEALRHKFIRSVMLGEQKSKRFLEVLEDGAPREAQRVLEIGSGTGGFLAVAMQRYKQVVGVDIAMRWLHVSRRRFMDLGLPVPPLVCCCAEYLPFCDDAFDLIASSSTLEFTRDQDRVLSECARTLRSGGSFYVNTVNRYSIARDPYVYLWAVGLLPRAFQSKYVRWRRGASYENIKTLTYRQLRKMAEKHFSRVDFLLPDIDDASLSKFPLSVRLQVRTYRLLKQLPPLGLLLRWIGPGWDARFHKI